MPDPIFDRDTLINMSGCYSGQVLATQDRQAINISNMAGELADNGGTNYVGNLHQLIIDSSCYATLLPDQFAQINSQIIFNNYVNANGGVGIIPDINAQLKSAACIRNATQEQIIAATLYLKAKLGYHYPYPQ